MVLFSITLDEIKHHSSYEAVAEWQEKVKESAFFGFLPEILRSRKILKPLVRRKLVV